MQIFELRVAVLAVKKLNLHKHSKIQYTWEDLLTIATETEVDYLKQHHKKCSVTY